MHEISRTFVISMATYVTYSPEVATNDKSLSKTFITNNAKISEFTSL